MTFDATRSPSKILLVDDERSIRVTLSEFLKDADYEVEVAEDANVAMEMLSRDDFDVVVTDIVMPRITGVKLLEAIQESAPRVQVILMTGEPTVETASKAVRADAFDYLTKPIRKGELVRTVTNAVKVKTLDDERRRLQEENLRYQENLEKLVDERTKALCESEQTLKKYTGQLETLNTITAVLSTSLELEKVLELILDQIGKVISFDSGAVFLLEKNGLRVVIDHGFVPSVKGVIFPGESQLFNEVQATGKPLILKNVTEDPRFLNWGHSANIASWMGVPLIVRETLIGYMTLDSLQPDAYSREAAELVLFFAAQAAQAISNARQYSASKRRAEQLSALRKIDQAITGSFDVKLTLKILLEHLLEQLQVDAAAVLGYYKNLQTLSFLQGEGFHTTALQNTSLRVGMGHAGKAALERRSIFISDLNQPENGFSKSPEFGKEGFHIYYGIPLIAKNELVGVLEIFHRSPLNPTDEWINFVQVLAGQAAIAIDNNALFHDLQRSNMELMSAYDATIEGWAKALELRDMETEGHSRRVVKITMVLAEMLNIREEDLIHTRRGALLHDIGKMGVPDAILQKPGKLNDEEWEIMRMHPVYAYEWLSSIEYLRPALDIPHYHHERWDGVGYPSGLEGKQIPLSARIFAIVDVWDALRSERPYRKAWSKEKTLAHIQAGSGKHFDPEVVEVFLELVASNNIL